MRTIARTPLGSVSAALGAAIVVAMAIALPTTVQAQTHGGQITKICAGPSGNPSTPVLPGQTITCNITVTNQDDFSDQLRIDSIVDIVHHAGTCPAASCAVSPPFPLGTPPDCTTPNLLTGLPSAKCVGGAQNGLPCTSQANCAGPPAGVCSPSCVGGARNGLSCTSQMDCPGPPSPGTCSVTLGVKGDPVTSFV